MENPTTLLKRQALCFSSYENEEYEMELRLGTAHERKKGAFL